MRELRREVTEMRETLDRLTTLHLRLAVEQVHLDERTTALEAAARDDDERPDVDHTLAQLVSNLADVRRHLPA